MQICACFSLVPHISSSLEHPSVIPITKPNSSLLLRIYVLALALLLLLRN